MQSPCDPTSQCDDNPLRERLDLMMNGRTEDAPWDDEDEGRASSSTRRPVRVCRLSPVPRMQAPPQVTLHPKASSARIMRPPSLIGKKLDCSIADLDEFTFEVWVEIEKEKVPVYGRSESLDCMQAGS